MSLDAMALNMLTERVKRLESFEEKFNDYCPLDKLISEDGFKDIMEQISKQCNEAIKPHIADIQLEVRREADRCVEM
jgi:spore cortex formation protein SpoVR/YcgB (stage V sporulation)